MKLVRSIKMCLNEIYSKFRTGKNLTNFIFRIVWNKEMFYLNCF